MKKILPALVLGSLLAALVLPVAVSAQEPIPKGCTMRHNVGITGCPAAGKPCTEAEHPDIWGICCMMNTLFTATNWFFYILIILSTIMIIWGAFGILFAAGDPEKMKKGRTTVIYALAGIAIALFAKVIPAIVKFMMGV